MDYNNQLEKDKCSICLEPLEFKANIATTIIQTECGHKFHYHKCWKKLWEKAPNPEIKIDCPMCRSRLGYEGEILTDKRYIYLLECHIADEEPAEENEDIIDTMVHNITRLVVPLQT
jgi:DNA-directed RNA polymerase subunit RPC12/RpoP